MDSELATEKTQASTVAAKPGGSAGAPAAPIAGGPGTPPPSAGGGGSAANDSPFQVTLDYLLRCFEVEENSRRHLESTKMMIAAMVAIVVLGLFRFGLDLFERHRLVGSWQFWEHVFLFFALACFIWSFWSLLWGLSVLVGFVFGVLSHWPRVLVWKIASWFGGVLSLVWWILTARQPFKWVHEAMRSVTREYWPEPDPDRFQPASGHLSLLPTDLEGLPEPGEGSADLIREIAILRCAQALQVLFKKNVHRDEAIRRAKQWFVIGVVALVVALILYTRGPQETRAISQQVGATAFEIGGRIDVQDHAPRADRESTSDDQDSSGRNPSRSESTLVPGGASRAS